MNRIERLNARRVMASCEKASRLRQLPGAASTRIHPRVDTRGSPKTGRATYTDVLVCYDSLEPSGGTDSAQCWCSGRR